MIDSDPAIRLAELHHEMASLGILLDRDNMSDAEFQELDREYDAVFDRLREAEDAVLAAPISSDSDVIAKLRVITERVRLGSDVLESLERLQHQVEQYAISGRQ